MNSIDSSDCIISSRKFYFPILYYISTIPNGNKSNLTCSFDYNKNNYRFIYKINLKNYFEKVEHYHFEK